MLANNEIVMKEMERPLRRGTPRLIELRSVPSPATSFSAAFFVQQLRSAAFF
jgi:hypothetical protein